MTKKSLSLLTILSLIIILSGCGQTINTDTPSDGSVPEGIITGDNQPAEDVEKEIEDGDISDNIMPNDEEKIKYDSATIKTSMGDITFKFYSERAPKTVKNFIKLAEEDFYDGIIFHRVIKDFMLQTGDPTGTGKGGPGYKFEDEVFADDNMVQGNVAMANSGPNTNGSQFFIITKEDGTPWLNGNHTIFGEVTKGLDVALTISDVATGDADKPLEDVVMEDVVLNEIGAPLEQDDDSSQEGELDEKEGDIDDSTADDAGDDSEDASEDDDSADDEDIE